MPAQHRFYLLPRPRFIWTPFIHSKKLPRSRSEASVFTPLGETSIYTAWRAQYLRRLAVNPVFIPLDSSYCPER